VNNDDAKLRGGDTSPRSGPWASMGTGLARGFELTTDLELPEAQLAFTVASALIRKPLRDDLTLMADTIDAAGAPSR
jgi:hypothetical protein